MTAVSAPTQWNGLAGDASVVVFPLWEESATSAIAPRLMGWYHPPRHPDGRRECGVVLCPPLGYDLFSMHRTYRLLANHLATQGFPVLRFDYHGTGDSAGDNAEPGRLQAWLQSIEAAGRQLQRLSDVRELVLFGVRAGGLLAAAAAERIPAVTGLALWAPFVSGRLYAREMKALAAMNAAENNAPEDRDNDSVEAGGFLLSSDTLSELSQLNLLQRAWPSGLALLLLHRDDLPLDERLARHAEAAGAAVASASCAGYGDMMRDAYEAVAPVALQQQVAAWLLSRYPLSGGVVPPAWPLAETAVLPLPLQEDQLACEEIALRFGRAESLFGVLTRPCLPVERTATAAVFLSVGANHHIGPHRQYVTMARALAAQGFSSLRFDMRGVGESELQPQPVMEGVYDPSVVRDVKAAIDMLQSRLDIRRFVLVGICSGAYQAYHAAAEDARVTGVVLINPQVFEWKPGLTLKVALGRKLRPESFYRRALWTSDTWRRLFNGEIKLGSIFKGLVVRRLQRIVSVLRQWFSAPDPYAAGILARFRRILHRGIDTHLIYSDNDAGLDEMETHLGSQGSRLRRNQRFSLHMVPRADHTFTQYRAQLALQDQLEQHFVRRFGGVTSQSP